MDDAISYHKNNCIQKKMVQESFEKYGLEIKWKKNDNRIIDLGCGEGTVITILKKYFPSNANLIGCDKSENMVKLANELYYDEHTNFIVSDIVGDITEKFKTNFSHVFSFYALQWVKDHELAFNNIHKLLEEDGECFLVFPTFVSVHEVYRSLARNNKWSTWVYDVDRYISAFHDLQDPKAEVTRILKNIGFNICVVEHEDVFYIFNDMESLRRSLQAINPFKIPFDKYDEFWEDYLKLWKQFNGFENDNTDFFRKHIKFSFKQLTIHAQKTKDSIRKKSDQRSP